MKNHFTFEHFKEIESRYLATKERRHQVDVDLYHTALAASAADVPDLLIEVAKLKVRCGRLLAVADAADTVMHHFADAHYNAADFERMVSAMEPLRQALLSVGYGGER